jgi:hypothetical protein
VANVASLNSYFVSPVNPKDAYFNAREFAAVEHPNFKSLPKFVDVFSGKTVEPTITADVKGASQKHVDEEQQDQVAMAAALQCFHAQAEMFAPRFKDEQVSNQTVAWGKVSKGDDRQLWIEGDQTEHQRMKDFKACKPVHKSAARGKPIARLLRVCNRKQSGERRVRWAYDQKMAENDEDVETFASVARLQTSRLLNMRATHKGRRVRRGDFVSAFLHIDCEKFWTYYPKDHPDAANGYILEWSKLLYGKGNASRGLRQDIKSMVQAIGFEECSETDPCLYRHKTKDLLGVFWCWLCTELGNRNDQAAGIVFDRSRILHCRFSMQGSNFTRKGFQSVSDAVS